MMENVSLNRINGIDTEEPRRVDTIRNRNKQNFCYHCGRYFKEFTEVTGIHGLRYVTEDRSTVERILWIIILLISLFGFAYMSAEIWDKYENGPIVVNFGDNQLSISEIPFPALTICPESKADKLKFNLTELTNTNTKEKLLILNSLRFMCGKLNESIEFTPTDNFYKIIEKIQTDPEEIFLECNVIGLPINCSEIFFPVFTDEGICYSFNILKSSDMFFENIIPFSDYYNTDDETTWDIEHGYKPNKEVSYPIRVFSGGGAEAGLSINLRVRTKSIDRECKGSYQGFKVVVHNPLDIPRPSKNYFRIPLSRSVISVVQPQLIQTSKEVQSYSVEKRQCYFQSEKQLKYFKMYTQSNCNLECLSDLLYGACGCVKFFMPRTETMPVCGTPDLECVTGVEGLSKLEQLINYSDEKMLACACKPLCTTLDYDVTTSHSNYDGEYFDREQLTTNNDGYQYSLLEIYFKNDQFLNYKRNELYGISDLISNFGGLLGLFTGFSLITAVEILYFLSLRIYYNVRIFGQWAGAQNEVLI